MRGIGSLLLLLAAVAAALAGGSAARQQRPEAEMRAGPRDIREIFLTVPLPTHTGEDSTAEYYATFMDTFEKRLRLIEEPFVKPGEYENVIDAANGYLRLNLSDNWGQYVILTHFTRADGSRLVVLQMVNVNHVERDPHTEDYFYTLKPGGHYDEIASPDILPPIAFEDFWGQQPPPPPAIRKLFEEEHLYNIEWPRRGTTAVVRSYPPYNRNDRLTAAERRARDTYGRRRYETMQLVWDREGDVFRKGSKREHRPGSERARAAEEPPLPKLCAGGEATIFNCAIDEGGKFLSVCGSKMGELFEGRGYIQYRFGRPGRIELEYPGERRRRAADFTLDYKQAQGRSHFARLWFDSGPYRYTVYEEVYAGERAADVRKEARVEVRTLQNLREAVGVARSFRCLDPVQGSLANLKDLVTAAPAR